MSVTEAFDEATFLRRFQLPCGRCRTFRFFHYFRKGDGICLPCRNAPTEKVVERCASCGQEIPTREATP